MRLPLAVFALLLLMPSSFAESKFDGSVLRSSFNPVILQDGTVIDPYACSGGDVEGTVLIEGNKYGDATALCLTPGTFEEWMRPLFDVTCRGEWGSRTQRELLMLYRDTDDRDRLLMGRPNSAADFERCN